MIRESKIFTTSDGKEFKTYSTAINHERKIKVENVKKYYNMTENQITSKLKEISSYHATIKALLNHESDWTKWELNILDLLVKENLFKEKEKTTLYIFIENYWGNKKEKELFKVNGANFADPELYCEDEYKVVEIIDETPILRKIVYDYKYTWSERIKKKLDNGEELSESDIKAMTYELDEVHRKEGHDRRWSRSVTSVVELEGKLYAIDWEEGLTENQENEFYNQPYPVKLETEEIVVTKTNIIKI